MSIYKSPNLGKNVPGRIVPATLQFAVMVVTLQFQGYNKAHFLVLVLEFFIFYGDHFGLVLTQKLYISKQVLWLIAFV
jgi:hypothetical protein